MSTGIEQRKHRRLDLSLPVCVLVEGGIPKAGWAKDISIGGLCFTLDEKCEVGSKVKCEIQLAPDSPAGECVSLHCIGKVVRVGEGDGGGRVAIGTAIEYYEFLKGSSLPHGFYSHTGTSAHSPGAVSELWLA